MIQMFEDFNEIHAICKKYRIKNYSIKSDGSIDVDGNIDLYDSELEKLPLRFGRVSGDFICSYNFLISLEGAPYYVGGDFKCFGNELTSLKGAPKVVEGDFRCFDNPLPQPILDNIVYIYYIATNQDDYGIWRTDGSFNEARFNIMMKDKDI